MDLGTNFGDFTLKIFKIKDNREDVYSKIKSSMDMDFIDRVELQGNYINFYVKPGKMLDTVENSIGTFGKYPNTFQN